MRWSARTKSPRWARALALGSLSVVAACGWFPRKATRDDCEHWSNHFARLTKDAGAAGLKKCAAARHDASGLLEKAGNTYFEREIDRKREDIVRECESQIGGNYITKDADCYLRATQMSDWTKCGFQTPFFVSFARAASDFERGFDPCKAAAP